MNLTFAQRCILAVVFVGCSRAPSDAHTTETDASVTPPKPAASAAIGIADSAPTAAASAPSRYDVTTKGAAWDLRVSSAGVRFCDKGNYEWLSLVPGTGRAIDGNCRPPREPNVSCSGVAGASVRTPSRGPDDVLDASGHSFPLKGHVRDCANDASVIALATGGGVVLVDTATGRQTVIAPDDADRVGVSAEWVAWTRGETLHVQRR
jgi:hypothetical protein